MQSPCARLSLLAGGVGALLLLNGCASAGTLMPRASLEHFQQVDERLYRGAQPNKAGFRKLRDMGVKTIVSLRAHSKTPRRRQRALVESLGMRWVSLPMRMYWRPSDQQLRTFFNLVDDPTTGPVFIHCQRGEDRTGSMVAAYRVARQGWQPRAAYDEAVELGMADWNPFTRDLILHDIAPGGEQSGRL